MTPAIPRQPLAREMRALADRFRSQPVFLDEVVQASHGRGYDLFLILLSLPFLTPIPLPFLSTPFGLVICLAGSRMALGRRPWWPRWFRQKQLPPRFFPRLLRATSWIIGTIELLVKPRLRIFHQDIVFQRVAGVIITLSGMLLLLPLPIPFSNFFPALTVVLLASGALEQDGLCFLAGCLTFCLSAGYFTLLAFGGVQAFGRLIGV